MKPGNLFNARNLLIALVVLAVPLAAQADFRIGRSVHTDEYQMHGQTVPASDDTTYTWLSKGNARVDMGDSSSILVLGEKGTIYMLNHTKKQYSEIPVGAIDKIAAAKAAEGESEQEAANRETIMSMMKIKITVTPTEEKKKIRDWNCQKYTMTMELAMTKTSSEIWATEDVKIDYDLYTKVSNAMMSILPGYDKAMEEMKKIKGTTVLNVSTSSVMGTELHRTHDLVEVVEKKAPAGTFEIPKEYEKTDMKVPGMP